MGSTNVQPVSPATGQEQFPALQVVKSGYGSVTRAGGDVQGITNVTFSLPFIPLVVAYQTDAARSFYVPLPYPTSRSATGSIVAMMTPVVGQNLLTIVLDRISSGGGFGSDETEHFYYLLLQSVNL